MRYVAAIATYLPCWGSARRRVAGGDEDAVTLAVEAGRAAIGAAADGGAAIRTERPGRVAPVDEGLVGQCARGVLMGDGGADLPGIHASSPPGGPRRRRRPRGTSDA